MVNVQPRGTLDYPQMFSCVLSHVPGHPSTHSTFTSVNFLLKVIAHYHSHHASITQGHYTMNQTLLPQSTPAAGGTKGKNIRDHVHIYTLPLSLPSTSLKILEQNEPSVLF